MAANTATDRLAMRVRPEGTAVMGQNWEKLLFLHWSIDASGLPEPVGPPRAHFSSSLQVQVCPLVGV